MKRLGKSLLALALALSLLLTSLPRESRAAIGGDEKQAYIESLSQTQAERDHTESQLQRGKKVLIGSVFFLMALLAFSAVRRTRN